LLDSPVQEDRKVVLKAGNLAEAAAVLVLAADPVAVVDPAAGLVVAVAAAGKEGVRVLAVDPVAVAEDLVAVAVVAVVAAAEAVFH
jgi:hypothetical protein